MRELGPTEQAPQRCLIKEAGDQIRIRAWFCARAHEYHSRPDAVAGFMETAALAVGDVGSPQSARHVGDDFFDVEIAHPAGDPRVLLKPLKVGAV